MSTSNTKAKFQRLFGGKTSASSAFQHQPLDSSNKEIRLIQILRPKRLSDQIQCTIRQTRLENAGDYIALSYTWGSPHRTRTILLNGHEFEVTLNLEDFLREIRTKEKYMTFWIDAICINQNDLAERSSQVLIMKDIYSHATFVIAWLGRAQAYSERVFDFVEELANLIENNLTQNPDAISAWIQSNTSPLFANCQWMAFADLLNRSYWSRAWIVQEVALSKSAVVMYGKYGLQWNYFLLASSIVFTHIGEITAAAFRSRNQVMDPAEVALASFRLERLCEGSSKVRVITGTARSLLPDQPQTAFYDIIRRHQLSSSTNPHDKIYAFLGLARAGHTEIGGISVDYTISTSAIFRSMTIAHLENNRGLYILNDCYGIGRPAGFSSWTPCYENLWKESGELRFLEYPPHIVYKAASDVDPQYELAENNETLLLRGIRIDTIKAVGHIADLRPGEMIEQGLDYNISNVHKSWERIAGIEGLLDPSNLTEEGSLTEDFKKKWLATSYRGGIHSTEAWLRTLLCNPNADLDTNYFNPEFGIDLQQRWKDKTISPDGTEDEHIRVRMTFTSTNRRFYVTSKGLYGLGPPVASVGDIVCIFLGGRTPFLIRASEKYYEVVSETYVQGLMRGEAVDALKRGILKEETFPLR